LIVLSVPAAKIIGAPSKKENLAAVEGDSFVNRPPAIVIPDRDVPGSSAIAWAHPIKKLDQESF
jgi:hypothetical protein